MERDSALEERARGGALARRNVRPCERPALPWFAGGYDAVCARGGTSFPALAW